MAMNRDHDAAGHLLFGLLALQTGLIDQARLVAAFHAWTRDKARPLADHLVALGHLDAAHRPLLEGLATAHLAQHCGEAEKSLAAIPAGRSTRESLARIGDPDIAGTLAHVGSGSTQHDADPDRTASYAVGTATSDGQRFRVLRPHARGGLGAVFVALDAELHREVALKQILDAHADDPTSRTRFLLEAEITGGLEHPGIVPVYGLGTYGDGRPYYAMRFIRGDSLKAAIERFHAADGWKDPGGRSLELRQLLRRFLDICNAIEYAHSRGVLHRDIKPGNVIVGRHGETLVVDWGLAKAQGQTDALESPDERPLVPSSASGSAETLPGSALGTPAYMSPEQARGDLEHLGPRSDVYSLGATLYCLLTGRPPVEHDDMGAVLRAVQQGDFPPPRSLDPSLDRALEAVCLKAMALRPEDRYGSARELAEDVERWTADEPVTAWPEPVARRARRWARRHKPLVACAAVLLAATVIALIAGTVLLSRANARTEKQRQVAEANYRRARAAVDESFTRVSESQLLDVPGLQPLRKELLEAALKYYQDFLRERGDDRAVRAESAAAYFRAADVTRLIGSHDEAMAFYRSSLDLYEALVREHSGEPRYQADQAIVCDRLGNLLRISGRADEALRVQRRGLTLRETLARAFPGGARYQNELARSHLRIGTLMSEAGRYDEAMAQFQQALAINDGLLRRGDLSVEFPSDLARRFESVASFRNDLVQSYLSVSYMQAGLGHDEEALRSRQRAVEIAERVAREHPADTEGRFLLAIGYGDLGVMLTLLRGPAEGLRAFDQGRAILEQLVAENPAVTDYQKYLAETCMNIAQRLEELGRSAEALGQFDKGDAILEDAAAANPTFTWLRFALAVNRRRAGGLLFKVGRRDEALRRVESARALLERLVVEDPAVLDFRSQLAAARHDLGTWRSLVGQRVVALGDLEAARAFREELVAANPKYPYLRVELANSYTELGRLKRVLGRAEEAAAAYEQARAIQEELVRSHRGITFYRDNLAYIYRGLGRLQAQTGRVAEARRSFAAARAIDEERADTLPLSRYNLACDLALTIPLIGRDAGASIQAAAAERRRIADEAMRALRLSLAAGYPAAVPRDDPDLDPLRQRPDFQLLMMDGAFPADPFAR
jgi:serine/threonine-protein kinase